jgi:D-glycero-beta-D-manno-heptose-7-phosphate kinase
MRLGERLKAKNKKPGVMDGANLAANPLRGSHAGNRVAKDSSVDLGRLLDLIGAFPQQTISVVGDFVLDEFVSGEISRISREAPVLILRHRRSESYPGGAANAVNNLVDLGARVLPVGVVGDDPGGH